MEFYELFEHISEDTNLFKLSLKHGLKSAEQIVEHIQKPNEDYFFDDAHGEIIKKIRDYCDWWEKVKIHAKGTNVKKFKELLYSVLYHRLVEHETCRSVGEHHGMSGQRVLQKVNDFNRWLYNKSGTTNTTGVE